jgi:cytochrome b561
LLSASDNSLSEGRSGAFRRVPICGPGSSIGLAAGHVIAALYHQYVRRDGLLLRMLPGLKRRAG